MASVEASSRTAVDRCAFSLLTGNFDLDSPADEIVYYYRLPNDVVQPDDPFRFVFLVAEGSPPNGRL